MTSREHLLHALYEAAELEHNLLCTYLYAAWSLKSGVEEGLTPERDALLTAWKRDILRVGVEEMYHLLSVWNITVALGGAPRIGRFNFPLDPGALPASIVVKLAPFSRETLQHFIFLERPADSSEPDGAGYEVPYRFARGNPAARHTPMPRDYDTVGAFYAALKAQLEEFVAAAGEANAFAGDRALQMTGAALGLSRMRPVVCMKTALEAFDVIVTQGEGAAQGTSDSHYSRFLQIRAALDTTLSDDPGFEASHPAAVNPVLRPPTRPQGRVWIEDLRAAATVDLANATYGLMLRALASAYAIPSTDPRKAMLMRLAIGMMHATLPLAEAAARLPAGSSHPGCNAGMSFTALRDSAALPPGPSMDRFFRERCRELADGGAALATMSPRHASAAGALARLANLCEEQLRLPPETPAATTPEVEIVSGQHLEIQYRGVRCIHARHCVTEAPGVFLANVLGPWIHPDAMDVEGVVEVAHRCPSGAIRYRRLDGHADEAAPPVNLATVREAGPIAFRADLLIDGAPAGYRVTLCRCGASKHKPFCDGSHKESGFAASGEPVTQGTTMLPERAGELRVDPEHDGPLVVSGNLEVVSGTGRIVARVTDARLCRCGGSHNKPFCDSTHLSIGFRSD